MSSRDIDTRRTLIVCLVLIVVTVFAYGRVASFGFVDYDDDAYVSQNPHVLGGLSAGSIAWAFTTSRESNWHPLTWLSHMLDVEMHGSDASGHHVTNLVLHLLNTLLLFLLLQRITRAPWPSAFVAALFAVHPLHVESVAWIAERKDVLSTFFGLLAVWAYVEYARRPRRGAYLLTALLFAMSLMAKPMLVTLPFLLLLFDYWPLDRLAQDGEQPRATPARLVLEKIPLLALSAASCVVTLLVQSSQYAMAYSENVSFPLRLANALVSYERYLGRLFWPADLAVFYTHPNLPGGTPWSTARLAIAVALLVGVSLLVAAFRRKRYLTFGWLWYLGTLVPVIGMVQVGGQAMADRYMYVPLIGPAIMIAWGAAELPGRYKRVVAIAGAALILACMTATWFQVRTWRSSEALFGRALAVSPTAPIVNANLGHLSHRAGKTDEAIRYFRRAIEIQPDHAEANYNLGYVLRSRGETEEAIGYLRQAVQVKPDFVRARYNLGNALLVSGRTDEAAEHLREALRVDPEHAKSHYRLGDALRVRGEIDDAIDHYVEAVRLSPNWGDARYVLAQTLLQRGRLDEATEQYLATLQLDPAHFGARHNLGLTLLRLGRGDEALTQLSEAVRLQPDQPATLAALAAAYAASARFDEAADTARRALARAEATDPGRVDRIRAQLERYEQQRP